MNENSTILIVDDDEVDVRLLKRSLQRGNISNPIVVAYDGYEALAMLKGVDGHPPVSSPCLILLDLNMPRLSGLVFLEMLRADDTLRTSIVFVLTTSNSDRDRAAAYQHNIAGYISKDRAGDDLSLVGRLIEQFFAAVDLPSS